MFLRLCGTVNSFEFHRCLSVLPRWDAYRFRSGTQGLNAPDTQHPSFTARTTRVSNPVRSPRFRASASVAARHAAFAIGVLRDIYAFHRYTAHSVRLRRTQGPQFRRLGGVETPAISPLGLKARLRTL